MMPPIPPISFASSSSASAQSGDQGFSSGNFAGGSINNGLNNQTLLIGGALLIAFMLWRKK